MILWISEQAATFLPIQQKLSGFYNREEVRLLRGTH
jgi:hypothetical protein